MEDLEKKIKEAAEKFSPNDGFGKLAFSIGAKSPEAKEYWQQGMYTEEEVLNVLHLALGGLYPSARIDQWFEVNKKK